jgi:hypothetical protein
MNVEIAVCQSRIPDTLEFTIFVGKLMKKYVFTNLPLASD